MLPDLGALALSRKTAPTNELYPIKKADRIKNGNRMPIDPTTLEPLPLYSETETFRVRKDPDNEKAGYNWHDPKSLAEWVKLQVREGRSVITDPYRAILRKEDIDELRKIDKGIPPFPAVRQTYDPFGLFRPPPPGHVPYPWGDPNAPSWDEIVERIRRTPSDEGVIRKLEDYTDVLPMQYLSYEDLVAASDAQTNMQREYSIRAAMMSGMSGIGQTREAAENFYVETDIWARTRDWVEEALRKIHQLPDPQRQNLLTDMAQLGEGQGDELRDLRAIVGRVQAERFETRARVHASLAAMMEDRLREERLREQDEAREERFGVYLPFF